MAFTQHRGSSHLLRKDVDKQTMHYYKYRLQGTLIVWDRSFMRKESNVSLLAGRPRGRLLPRWMPTQRGMQNWIWVLFSLPILGIMEAPGNNHLTAHGWLSVFLEEL